MSKKESPGRDWHRAEARNEHPIVRRTGEHIVSRPTSKRHTSELPRSNGPKNFDGDIENLRPLVAPGDYEVKFSHWATQLHFVKAGKLVLYFTICTMGEYFGLGIERWYNVRLKEPPRRGGRFAASFNSDVVREYASIVGLSRRNDRIALSKYRPLLIVARVRTVGTTRSQVALPPTLQYSVIGQLLRSEAGH